MLKKISFIVVLAFVSSCSISEDRPPEPKNVKIQKVPSKIELKPTPTKINLRSKDELERWNRYASAYIASGKARIEDRDLNAAEIADKMIVRERERSKSIPF